MSPVVTGNASSAVHDHGHVSIRTVRRDDIDPFEALEQARARNAIRSPIKTPVGGWTGPEPVLPPEKPKKKKARARAKREPAPPKLDLIERKHELAQQWDTFRALAADGATARQIAEALGLNVDRVRRDAKAAGITLTRGKAPGRPIEWDVDEGARLAAQGLTAREIAEHVGSNAQAVRRVLGRAGITLTDGRAKFTGGHNSLRRRGEIDPAHARDLYAEHGNATHVARLIGTSPQTVARILHDEGVHVRSSGEVQRGRPGKDGAAALKALMRAHGTTPIDVRRWADANGHHVARNGIPPRAVVDAYLAAKETP